MENALGLGGFCFSVLGACVVAWGIWRAWTRPQQSENEQPAPQPAPAHWSIGGELRRLFLVEGVNDYAERPPVVMSRSENSAPVDRLSSPDGQDDGRTDSPVYSRDELLIFYKWLRKHGVGREDARPVLKLMRIPLSNDVWSKAQPPADDPAHVTPIAGRATDADFPYQPIDS